MEAPLGDPQSDPRGGGRVFFALLLAAALVTGLWLAAGLPRAEGAMQLPPDPEWRGVHDAARVLPDSIVRELEGRAERLRRRRGVEVEVHTAPEDSGAGWLDEVVATRLGGLEDGRPRALVLVARGPLRVEVHANQGLEEVLDAAWKDQLAAHVAPALKARRLDLAARRGVYRLVGAIAEHLGEGDSDAWGEGRLRHWPRRRGGRTDAEWHQLTTRGVGGILLLGMLTLLSSGPGRRALRGWPAAPERRGPGWFQGAGDAGGFGGGARAGRKPRPGW